MTESEYFSPYRPDGKLYGFICVVTGATQPVGKAIVLELAAHGAACIYEVSKEFPNTKIIGYPLNVANEEASLVLLDDVLNAWGRLDVWVCSAGLLGPPTIEATTPNDLHKCLQANAMAPFFALRYAPAAMAKTTPKGNYANAAPKDQKYGSIVVVGSIASSYGGCWGPAYTMSSHAALGVVRAGVSCLKGSGVRINCISAGQIDVGDTPGTSTQFPPSSMQSEEAQKTTNGLERAGLPQEVAKVAGFLASGFSSYITGTNLVVDGGASTMCPVIGPT
ncbi:MAG: hypothetical protein M1817_002415 [Caeruleum heppii]|nr:MAG: hypothetical protein M1817_002415 [Caeruleum heppii]